MRITNLQLPAVNCIIILYKLYSIIHTQCRIHGHAWHSGTGQSINELENGPSSYRQKGVYFEWVFMK